MQASVDVFIEKIRIRPLFDGCQDGKMISRKKVSVERRLCVVV